MVQAVLAQHAAQEEAAEVASQQSPPHRYTPHRYTAHHTHLHCTQCTMCTADIYTPHCTHVHCTQQQQLSSGAQARAALNDLHRAEAELAELQRMHALQQCTTVQVEATCRPIRYLRGLGTTRLPPVPLGVWLGCNWSTGCLQCLQCLLPECVMPEWGLQVEAQQQLVEKLREVYEKESDEAEMALLVAAKEAQEAAQARRVPRNQFRPSHLSSQLTPALTPHLSSRLVSSPTSSPLAHPLMRLLLSLPLMVFYL